MHAHATVDNKLQELTDLAYIRFFLPASFITHYYTHSLTQKSMFCRCSFHEFGKRIFLGDSYTDVDASLHYWLPIVFADAIFVICRGVATPTSSI